MFSAKSFSPVSFSLDSFRLSQASHSQEGRSGYWRLFYYQLQEKALAERTKPTIAKGRLKPKKVIKPRHAELVTPEIAETKAQECPVPRRKLFRPAAYVPSIPLPDTMWVYNTLNELRFTFPHKRSIVRLSEPSVAANETTSMGNEVLLLLLAA